ncbi:MAG: class I SAM-dependent DNA methyltransferase [Ruminococcus sp.]|nr:class I SAM-dependent DNA methyltransferase [Ruminococcus sp.]
MTDAQQKKAAKEFSSYWKDKGYEKGESQKFWIDLLQNVYGVKDAIRYISFEDKVHLDHTSFIDGYIEATHVMIEQKSLGKDLRKGIKQSDGSVLSPFQQAKRYSAELPYDDRPRWIVTCNFSEFLVYDMNKPNSEPEQILLKNLSKEYYRLQFLVDIGNIDFQKEMQISVDAGKITEKLYKSLIQQYQNPDSVESLKSLNMLCVRLVFCFYAENSGVFARNQFKNYMRSIPVNKWHRELKDLFKILDTKAENRDPDEDEKLNAFPYVNGGLFADENIEIPRFTEEIVNIIINEACVFDWADISPTIFGAVFESTLNPETRRKGGVHYTSIENIHKIIDSLFLDDLKNELNDIKALKQQKLKRERLEKYRKKLASLVFLDPACGSGNFLTETYISLRKLENEALIIINESLGILESQYTLSYNPIEVSISQFYGIEINDFAVAVAKTALWIAESQMMQETEKIIKQDIEFLPLKSYPNIIEDNAIRVNWESIVPKEKLNYIMGNPPFVGYSQQSNQQKADLSLYSQSKNLDYCASWFYKASDFMQDTEIRTAFVSTNSICQGEQVSSIWKPLFERFGVHIDFAYKSFKWSSEASIKAQVHCVIVGFSKAPNTAKKRLFDNGVEKIVKNINCYLVEADDIIIENRTKPISKIPNIMFGSMPNDNKGLLSNYSDELKNEIINKYPQSSELFRPFLGANEFINNKTRWCLWLIDISPNKIISVPPIYEAVKGVRESRTRSSRKSTREQANTPTLFGEIRQPNTEYILIPRHSSEKRRYIPMGYISPDVICGDANLIIPNATLYHFGVLTSNVHMAWMRTVCGRLEMRYRYSKDIVYNNFPWCNPTEKQRETIEKTAQAILDARAEYPDCSLADLYDELTMPPKLRKAHQSNDFAVMAAYGFDKKITESECVAELMKMYQKLTK